MKVGALVLPEPEDCRTDHCFLQLDMNLRELGVTRTHHCSSQARMIEPELAGSRTRHCSHPAGKTGPEPVESRTHHCSPLAHRIVLLELEDFHTHQSLLAWLVCTGKV